MKIYISLPITGQEEAAREKAAKIERELRENGHEPINPFKITEKMADGATYGQLIAADLACLIDEAEAVLFCKGWERSKGCAIERMAASATGKQIFFENLMAVPNVAEAAKQK